MSRQILIVLAVVSMIGVLFRTALIFQSEGPKSSRLPMVSAQEAGATPTPHMTCIPLLQVFQYSANAIAVGFGEEQRHVIKIPSLHPRCNMLTPPTRQYHALTQPSASVTVYSATGVQMGKYWGYLENGDGILLYPDCTSQDGYDHYTLMAGARFDVTVFYQCCFSCQPNIRFTPMPTP